MWIKTKQLPAPCNLYQSWPDPSVIPIVGTHHRAYLDICRYKITSTVTLRQCEFVVIYANGVMLVKSKTKLHHCIIICVLQAFRCLEQCIFWVSEKKQETCVVDGLCECLTFSTRSQIPFQIISVHHRVHYPPWWFIHSQECARHRGLTSQICFNGWVYKSDQILLFEIYRNHSPDIMNSPASRHPSELMSSYFSAQGSIE